jgi:hypothetical protein
MSHKYIRSLAVVLSVSVAACNSIITNGEITHFRVGDEGQVHGPWHDSASGRDRVPRDDGDSNTRNDVFELALESGFLKYLPDLGGLNEVLIVLTFSNGAVERDEDRIVKILGPMRQQPDESFLPEIGRVIYGPTTLAATHLSVRVQVIEFDRDEADNAASFIEFLGSAAETLSLADPITSAEIRIAKEIAKTLTATNENDIVLDATFDLRPYDVEAPVAARDFWAGALPLRTGRFGLIKQEVPAPVFRFYPFTNRLELGWNVDMVALPFTFLLDTAAMPFTAALRAVADVPDKVSMSRIEWSEAGVIAVAERDLTLHSERRRLMSRDRGDYREKSWLVFSITNGHEALERASVRALTESDQRIVGMLKSRTLSEALKQGDLDATIEGLQKVRQAATEAEAKAGFRLSRSIVESDAELEKLDIDVATLAVGPFHARLRPAGDPLPVNLASIHGAFERQTAFGAGVAFSADAGATLPFGSYRVEIAYWVKGVPRTVSLPLKLMKTPSVAASLATDAEPPYLRIQGDVDGWPASVEAVELAYAADSGRATRRIAVTERGITRTERGIIIALPDDLGMMAHKPASVRLDRGASLGSLEASIDGR